MYMPPHPALVEEWRTLQNNHEAYERGALLLKLAAMTAFVAGYVLGLAYELTGGLALLVWAQESIYRTSQARLRVRLTQVEQLVRNDAPANSACQLHTEWQATRPGTAGLLAEYASHALRPTVAFPYAILLVVELVGYLG
jgi:hypothetical protein